MFTSFDFSLERDDDGWGHVTLGDQEIDLSPAECSLAARELLNETSRKLIADAAAREPSLNNTDPGSIGVTVENAQGDVSYVTINNLTIDPYDNERWNEEALMSAIKNRRGVTFLYKSAGDYSAVERRVNPEELEKVDSRSYLVGRDLTRGLSYRRFRLDRVQGPVKVNALEREDDECCGGDDSNACCDC